MKNKHLAILLFAIMLFSLSSLADFTIQKSPTFVLPPNLEVMEEEAFFGTAIKVLVIPDSIHSIESAAFASTHDLEKVYISKSVVRIEETAFDDCGSFTLYCEKGSYAEKWAEQRKLPCACLDSKGSSNEKVKTSFNRLNWIFIIIVSLSIRQLIGFIGRNSKECSPHRPREMAVMYSIAYNFP